MHRMALIQARNQTKDLPIADTVTVATSIWSRFWGLMGRSKLEDGHGMHITPCSSIHMFFMRFAIDVIFLDKSLTVTKVVHEIKPWRMALGGGGHSALELPVGAAVTARVEVGDVIEFSPAGA
jgi:uncharacterized membrane protein (UPF0127 family)